MDFNSVDQYLNRMHFAELYKALEQDGKESIIFEATELLKDKFRESLLTDRIVALQVNYMLEGETRNMRNCAGMGSLDCLPKMFRSALVNRTAQQPRIRQYALMCSL
jgi:hypothetical protein